MKCNDYAYKRFRDTFKEKVDSMREHPRYPELRKLADWCLEWHGGDGAMPIRAKGYMQYILSIPDDEMTEFMGRFRVDGFR